MLTGGSPVTPRCGLERSRRPVRSDTSLTPAWVFMQTICLVRFDQAFKHLDAIADALAAFGVAGASRFVEHADFLNVADPTGFYVSWKKLGLMK